MTTLFKAEWGSRAYGTHTETSDHDQIQVVIEPARFVTGLEEFKAKHSSTAPDGSRSTSSDTDVVTYGLRKYAALAVEGNPQVMATLFLTDFIEVSDSFRLLQTHRDICVSKSAGRKYLGYMRSQRANIENPEKSRTNRPELIHTHGWDTKFGMHAIRLGYQGLELISTGSIRLPMTGVPLNICRAVRAGEWTRKQGLELLDSLEATLESAIERSPWPERGDRNTMSVLLHMIYTQEWRQEDPYAVLI